MDHVLNKEKKGCSSVISREQREYLSTKTSECRVVYEDVYEIISCYQKDMVSQSAVPFINSHCWKF